MKKITPCLWFDNQAEEAAKFYTTLFSNSKIDKPVYYGESGAKVSGQKAGTVMTVSFTLEGLNFLGLNGGPMFKFSPSMSFFIYCETEKEINEKWQKLSSGGTVRMGLDKYPWSEKYGWTADKYGVEWQLILAPAPQKIVPAFLFVDKLFGKGEEAINFYFSVFENSKIEAIAKDEATKTVLHCAFTLAGQHFALMEGQGKHGYTFTHATSLIVNCETQEEIDYYWNKLSASGSTEQCGWLMDRYGVSWQIVPTIVGKLMSNPNKAEKAMAAILQMKKIDLEALKRVETNPV